MACSVAMPRWQHRRNEQLATQAHCRDQTTAMLCSNGAQGSWRSKVIAGIRQHPSSVAVALAAVVTGGSQQVMVHGCAPMCVAAFMSPPIKKRALPFVCPGTDLELLCSRFVSNVLRCWSVTFLLPDGAWTLITSTVTPPGPEHRNVCAVRGSPCAS